MGTSALCWLKGKTELAQQAARGKKKKASHRGAEAGPLPPGTSREVGAWQAELRAGERETAATNQGQGRAIQSLSSTAVAGAPLRDAPPAPTERARQQVTLVFHWQNKSTDWPPCLPQKGQKKGRRKEEGRKKSREEGSRDTQKNVSAAPNVAPFKLPLNGESTKRSARPGTQLPSAWCPGRPN